MSNEKFTKGDWLACGYLVSSNHNRSVAECGFSSVDNDEEELANAQLTAQSPAMYREIQNDIDELRERLSFLNNKKHKATDNYGKLTPEIHQTTNKLERKEQLLAKARGEL